MVFLSLGGLLTAAVGAVTAAKKHQASGKFASKTGEFQIVGAYALPGRVGTGNDQGVLVAVSNYGFASAIIDHYWDRQHFINKFFADDQTAVVWFQFDKTGKYRGMSYYFGSGDGCGYCFDPSVASSVKVSNGRIAGRVQHKDPKGATFDVTFDVPIAPTDYGKELPAGGGAPGQVYRAYHDAVTAANVKALEPLLAPDRRGHLKKQTAAFIAFLQDSHPDRYQLTRGFVTADHAVLLITGEKSPLGKVHTEAHLVREGNRWVVDDEILQMGDD